MTDAKPTPERQTKRKPPRYSIELMECRHGHPALAIGNTRITSVICCKLWRHVRDFYILDGPDEIAALLKGSPKACCVCLRPISECICGY